MAVSFCDEFNITKKSFNKTGALDIILNVDTKFFIDPALLSICEAAEFKNAEGKINNFFDSIKTLILASKQANDIFWKKADALLTFNEYSNTCLGYSDSGTNGNAIGSKLRKSLLTTLKMILDAGKTDIKIFELVGIFQENLGADRISDLITFVLLEDIIKYTDRITKELKITITQQVPINTKTYNLPLNVYNDKVIFLLPKAILSPLPVAYDYSDIDLICSENERVRNDINEIIDIGNSKKLSKSELLKLLITCPSFKEELLYKYSMANVEEYDFSKDPASRINWYELAKHITQKHPLSMSNIVYDEHGIKSILEQIIAQFKTLVENNNLYKLLYNDDKSRKNEDSIQLLFFGIADKYCKDNNIDCSREPNAGKGPIDFKFSNGYTGKILVEIKWSSNDLNHGFDIQLPTYMKQENSNLSYFLVIDAGTNEKKLNNFNTKYLNISQEVKNKIKYVYIDGKFKESASKARSL